MKRIEGPESPHGENVKQCNYTLSGAWTQMQQTLLLPSPSAYL